MNASLYMKTRCRAHPVETGVYFFQFLLDAGFTLAHIEAGRLDF